MTKSEKDRNDDAIRAAVRAQLTARPAPAKDHGNRQRRTSAGLWVRPFHSDSLGVSPDQVEEARESLRQQGVMADFDSDGRCIITSDKQYRQVAKACGMWDGAHGYGPKDGDGRRILTGRERETAKSEFRRAVEKGVFD